MICFTYSLLTWKIIPEAARVAIDGNDLLYPARERPEMICFTYSLLTWKIIPAAARAAIDGNDLLYPVRKLPGRSFLQL